MFTEKLTLANSAQNNEYLIYEGSVYSLLKLFQKKHWAMLFYLLANVSLC